MKKGKRNSLASKHSEEVEGEDRISKLPDFLIHDILSFIDIRCAVQTSLLSKKWKNIWTSLPFMSLDYFASYLDNNLEGQDRLTLLNRFVSFVDRVFSSHDNSNIQMIKLTLLVLNADMLQALSRWILAAVDHNVQDLTIKVGFFSLDLTYEIPHQLLNHKSLTSLTIVAVSAPLGTCISLILPKSMSLPRLKKLFLDGVSISNLELQRIVSSCPLMERVVVQTCDILTESKSSIIIDSGSLQVIALIQNSHTHLGLEDHHLTYTTKISAPNVKCFRCSGFMTEDYSLESLSTLVYAEFEMTLRGREEDETAETYSELPAEEKEVLAKRMMKLLGAIHNVRHLTLSSGFLEVLLQAPGSVYRQPFQLGNLEVLILNMRFTRGCLSSIAYLLQISPMLTSLKLRSKESNLAAVRDDDSKTGFSSTCTFSHLKFVEIREVEGCDNELNFLSFLLVKSVVLEKVYVFFRATSDSLVTKRQVRGFKRNLSRLAKASSVELKFF